MVPNYRISTTQKERETCRENCHRQSLAHSLSNSRSLKSLMMARKREREEIWHETNFGCVSLTLKHSNPYFVLILFLSLVSLSTPPLSSLLPSPLSHSLSWGSSFLLLSFLIRPKCTVIWSLSKFHELSLYLGNIQSGNGMWELRIWEWEKQNKTKREGVREGEREREKSESNKTQRQKEVEEEKAKSKGRKVLKIKRTKHKEKREFVKN